MDRTNGTPKVGPIGGQMWGEWEPKWGALGSLWDRINGTPKVGWMGPQMGDTGVIMGWEPKCGTDGRPKVGWMGP